MSSLVIRNLGAKLAQIDPNQLTDEVFLKKREDDLVGQKKKEAKGKKKTRRRMMPMNKSRPWKILCWNIRGINYDKKWNSIGDKIVESKCNILCLQETKRHLFDQSYLRNFCPQSFNDFHFLPSNGASRGILVA